MGARADRWIVVAGVLALAAAAALVLRPGDDAAQRPEDDADALPATRELPAPTPPPAVAVLRGRIGPGGPALSMDDPGPVPAAVRFLLSCQGEDGLFHADRSALDEDPRPEAGHDLALTGWAALALLDAVDLDGASDGADGLRRALDALAKAVGSGASAKEPADFEGVVLATWALAAGYGRTANESWRTPLVGAVARILAAKDPRGGWRADGDRVEDDLFLTVEVMGLAGEARPMRKTFPDSGALDDAVAGAGDWALSVRESRRAPIRGPGVVALEFLLRLIEEAYDLAEAPGPELVTGPPPLSALDHATVLLGSVLRFPRGGKIAVAWNRDVLEPAATRQRTEGRGAGSWDGNDARSRRYGRAYATALEALAWLFPRVPYRDPKGT